jgi:hypothetical protein
VVLPWSLPADRLRVCYVAERNIVQLPCTLGSYRLIPVDYTGCAGAPSELIRVKHRPVTDCPPTLFWGTITINGQPASLGTVVMVRVYGYRCGVGTVIDAAGHYYVVLFGWQEQAGCAQMGSNVEILVDGVVVDELLASCLPSIQRDITIQTGD